MKGIQTKTNKQVESLGIAFFLLSATFYMLDSILPSGLWMLDREGQVAFSILCLVLGLFCLLGRAQTN